MQVLGPEAAPLSERNHFALRAWTLLSNGMGGLDWQGFERVAAHLCITDEEWLIESLYAIKTHRPPEGLLGPDDDDTDAHDLDH